MSIVVVLIVSFATRVSVPRLRSKVTEIRVGLVESAVSFILIPATKSFPRSEKSSKADS